MTLLLKNGGYAFLIRLDLIFSMSLLKVPINETIGWSLGNVSLEENLRILGVP